MSGSVRYAKNWLRKERRAHERRPRNHMRKVHTGSVGSSVFFTVNRTSSIGDSSSSSSFMVPFSVSKLMFSIDNFSTLLSLLCDALWFATMVIIYSLFWSTLVGFFC